MHKIMNLLQELVDELFAIKNFESEIELKEAIDFYDWFSVTRNDLAIDIIRAKLTALNEENTQISDDEVSAIIKAFERHNKYDYNMFVVDTLRELCRNNSKLPYDYLIKILDTDEKKRQFENDFGRVKDVLFENLNKRL